MNYMDFLKSKMVISRPSGFEVSPEAVHPALKPHQRDAVRWAVKGGRRALFEAFGLGKTVQELEYCRLILAHEGGRALIVLPLGVRQEFTRDAVELLGMEAPVYVRTMAEVNAAKGSILLTNYERVRDGDIDPRSFTACALDEASVLRSFGSDTYQTFLKKFQGVPYKLVSTATPSPNRYKELIHYAGFLEIMDTGQALTRFFQRDSTKANNLTLYPHKEEEFWLWMSTWALFLQKPSDLGHSDEGYALPPLKLHQHKVSVVPADGAADRNGQTRLFRETASSLPDAAKEKRESIHVRVAKMKEIVEKHPGENFLLWHDLEDERRAIKKALPETVEIYGSMDYEERERRTVDFSEGKLRLFATKKELSGSGCNFQKHCHRAVFLGIDYKFNDFIQAIHPTWVVGENVAGIVNMALDTVLSDLENKGYACRAFILPACGVDAPHRRDRVAIVARHNGSKPDGGNSFSAFGRAQEGACSKPSGICCDVADTQEQRERRLPIQSGRPQQANANAYGSSQNVSHADCFGFFRPKTGESSFNTKWNDSPPQQSGRTKFHEAFAGSQITTDPQCFQRDGGRAITEQTRSPQPSNSGWWATEPNVGRVAHGVPSQVDRLKCLGNAVVPQQFYPIFQAIAEIELSNLDIQ